MCFLKTDDSSWPSIVTHLPTAGRLLEVPIRRQQAPTILSMEEVLHFRNDITPVRQCALHMALQRNALLDTIKAIVERVPSALLETNNNWDIPLMTALRHGVGLSTIEYLVDKDFPTLYQRNKEGKGPLHIAIEFACATVQSIAPVRMNGGTSRKVTLGQATFEKNSIAVVDYLLKRAPFAVDMGDIHDSTPLYLAIAHPGPGRIATFDVMHRGFEYIHEKGLSQIPNLFQHSCRRYRLLDKETPVHVACKPRHFSPYLIATMIKIDPITVIIKNKRNQTPLHLLCDPFQNSDALERRLNVLLPQELNDLIFKMINLCPQALKITDHIGRLPIHIYFESTFYTVKDPIVLSHMLKFYPQSCWIESPVFGSISYIVTRDALFSENPNEFISPDDVWEDKELTVCPEVMDPTLICLWLVLNHCHQGDYSFEPKLEQNATQSIQVINMFLSQVPKAVLYLSRYEANIRCVGRLVANALFSAVYRNILLTFAGSVPTTEEETWPFLMVNEMQREIDTSTYVALKHEVVNNIYRDNNTASMTALTPFFDRAMMLLIFPTITPNMVSPGHRYCPFYKSLSMYTFLKQKALPCHLNHDVLVVIAQWLTPQMILGRSHEITPFLEGESIPVDLALAIQGIVGRKLHSFLQDDAVDAF